MEIFLVLFNINITLDNINKSFDIESYNVVYSWKLLQVNKLIILLVSRDFLFQVLRGTRSQDIYLYMKYQQNCSG